MKTKEQHNPAQEYSLSRVLSPKAQEAILQICQTNPTNQHEQRARNYEASKMNSHIQNIIGHMALKDLNLPAQLPENPDDLDRFNYRSVEIAATMHQNLEPDKADKPHERLQTGLIAYIPDVIEATPILQSPGDHKKKDVEVAKEKIINFNHIIREAIDYHPNIDRNSILSLARHTAHKYYSINKRATNDKFNHEFPAVFKHIREIVRGVQHEVAFEDIMYQLRETYTCEPGTQEDDRAGIDYIISKNDDPDDILYVDVKASQRSTDKKNRESRYINDLAIWTGLEDEDFGGKLRITTRTAKEKRGWVESTLADTFDKMKQGQ